MAMGTKTGEQETLFVTHQDLKMVCGHPFYDALDGLLDDAKFDRHVEELCQAFYARKYGRPSLAPGVYFRCLLVGYFEGIDSERGIAWRTDLAGVDLGSREHILLYDTDSRERGRVRNVPSHAIRPTASPE